MAEIVTMPRLSDTMTHGKVSKWHKKVGDSVKEGDILAEIETDKAIQDFESEFSGTLLYIGIQENESISVNSVMAIIGGFDENISSLIERDSDLNEQKNEIFLKKRKSSSTSIFLEELPSGSEIITMPKLSDTMSQGKISKWHKQIGDFVKEGDVLAEIKTDKSVQDFESKVSGTILYIAVNENETASVNSILTIIQPIETNTNVNFTKKQRLLVSPLAKKLANNIDLDLSQIKGTGDNGRIIKKDIEKFILKKDKTSEELKHKKKSLSVISSPLQGMKSHTPNSLMRNVIAQRLSESKYTAPHYYLMIEVNMDEIIASRATIINSISDNTQKVSFNDIIIKATALSLRNHSLINSSWGEDKIIHYGYINIGVAVAIPDGLVVPVIENADYLSLLEISNSVKDLVDRAKNKLLKANEMENSTFSISNLGMFGIENFTSIINKPNSCILSVGAIIQKAIIKNKNIVVGNVMKLSLACDHRVVDGITGAKFLKTLKSYLENPITMLL